MGGSKEMFPSLRQIRLSRKALFIAVPLALPLAMFAQTPPMLTLQQAEAMAIKNHPQIQAAQNEVNFANQQIVINRARLLSEHHRRRDRIARQRSFENRRRRSAGVAPVRSRGPGRGHPAVDHRFRPDAQPGGQRALSGAGRGAELAQPPGTRCCWTSIALISTCCARRLR